MDWEQSLAEKYPISCKNIRCGAYAPEGWKSEIEQTLAHIEALSNLAGTNVSINQIKIKFGALRIYFTVPEHCEHRNLLNSSINGLISATESRTSAICKVCGEFTLHKGVNPFCEEHTPKDQRSGGDFE